MGLDLPTGTVTFLFTDLEGSTRLWQEHPDPYSKIGLNETVPYRSWQIGVRQ
jgi:class 3 adenylate cyclase